VYSQATNYRAQYQIQDDGRKRYVYEIVLLDKTWSNTIVEFSCKTITEKYTLKSVLKLM